MAAAGTASSGGYGTYQMTAAGTWTYTLDDSNSTVQALQTGAHLADTFTVSTVEGTQQLISIDITGANDAAVIGDGKRVGDRGGRREQRNARHRARRTAR